MLGHLGPEEFKQSNWPGTVVIKWRHRGVNKIEVDSDSLSPVGRALHEPGIGVPPIHGELPHPPERTSGGNVAKQRPG